MEYGEEYNDYYHGLSFQQFYRCYPVSFMNKEHLENGDKIIMPPSALMRLASMNVDYPMLFELSNLDAKRVSHCGVLEFSAEEGVIFLPHWMMENLLLKEGDIVQVKNTSLLKGKYMKIQPHTKDFLDISNPKAILERTLRNFTCLTTGDTIMMPYNNKKFYIDIIETKPTPAISIIETDCEVDFAPPLDYKEPEKPAASNLPSQEEPVKEETKLIPFTGVARRLDGNQSLVSVSPSVLKEHQPEVANVTNGPSASNNLSRRAGKLLFGSNVRQASNEMPKVIPNNTKKEPEKKEEQKFQAFTGKKYSLTD
ncbi:ubiquitin fusion degradation protein 1 homolog [Macadamia integrifolia]|uniref:ubiquitin fusion degradation protein 1 homolog n=1 Tax=Macadamia integrifolia TaxID=60698 RepID=UPI001C4F7809|nr:ubiquitin fusion degradation protein 1 homolog [Macadamia integrifolia]XP_042515705.1 ubiquitin fusion degradation protein 1 homolog [Macadamia integrifolia]